MNWEADLAAGSGLDTGRLAYLLLAATYVAYVGVGVASRVVYEASATGAAVAAGLVAAALAAGVLWWLGGGRAASPDRSTDA